MYMYSQLYQLDYDVCMYIYIIYMYIYIQIYKLYYEYNWYMQISKFTIILLHNKRFRYIIMIIINCVDSRQNKQIICNLTELEIKGD